MCQVAMAKQEIFFSNLKVKFIDCRWKADKYFDFLNFAFWSASMNVLWQLEGITLEEKQETIFWELGQDTACHLWL